MIKDILVHIPTERPVRPVIDASISLAATCEAHLDAVAVGYISTSAAYAIDGGAATAVAPIFEMEQARAAERSAAALAIFEAEARKAGVSYESRSIEDLPAEAIASISAAARLYDLMIVLQPGPERGTFDNTLSTEVLFEAGGPLLFVPYIFQGVFKARRIGVCWDGSRLAARALRDARHFLERAESVVAISINEAQLVPSAASAQKLARHLGRTGLAVDLIELTAAHSDIEPSILSLAADENLDMLVMGAYGNSRVQEGILGGITREMLKTMTLPTLMSH
jgi:nucleotide-binding universal stress UspA family protein